MRIALLTTPFFQDADEVTRIDSKGNKTKGKDKIIFGGAEKMTIDICHLLQEIGHVVTVYQPFIGANKVFTKMYKGIPFVMIPNDPRSWKHHTCPDLNWKFNELSALDELRIYFASYLCFPEAKSPCITISHGIYWDNIQGGSPINCLTENERKEFFKRQMQGFKDADVCVAVDSNIRKVLQAIEPGSEKRTKIIYNYVDTEQFVPAQNRAERERLNILFPRRLTAIRGSTEVTKAFMKLPEYDFTLVGQSHDEQAQEGFAKAHADKKNVKITWRPTDEMVELYQDADISLVPTISTEGLSLSLLESMSCGLPTITTPVGGLGDAVIDGYNALIYDPNHEDLSQYIEYLASDKELRDKMGKRAREIAVECFDITRWRNQWRELIRQFGG